MEKFEDVVLVKKDTSAMEAGTLLEYDATNHVYQKWDTGAIAGVLREHVDGGSGNVKAKVQFFGIVYEDELVTTIDDDDRANMRKIGLFPIAREALHPT